ncbi:MAG: hypothetical protein H0X29_02545 [Parachlamydiaceae bacterium]|nr:hypothetical protein [Parachlamydiaceae bacterium]
MFKFISLNKNALFFAFLVCSSTGSYAEDTQESKMITRGEDRGGDYRSDYQDRNINNGYRYGSGYGGAYGSGSGYGGAAAYPQYPYGPQSNAQAFPGDAEFNNTYEQNAHPPR